MNKKNTPIDLSEFKDCYNSVCLSPEKTACDTG